MLAPIIEDNRDAIADLCRTHRVKALWVFGSATRDAWKPETSDIDVLVDLGDYDDGIHRRFFGLQHDLEDLTGRPVDLITVNALGNPYLRDEVMETRRLVYGPADAQAAA